jgi:tRNA(Ile)-lysidine synthase
MERAVLKHISQTKMICKGDTVIVGVSGGADSMALLHILKEWRSQTYIKIIAAHVNHNLREEESDKDEILVTNYCKEHNIELRVLNARVREYCDFKGVSLEEGGRIIRYNFYNLIKKKHKSVKIATGHHKDDQVETVIMRIIRGTGINGLKGIEPIRKDGVVRPLLPVCKEDILGFCQEKRVPYRTDASNLEVDYHRNKIRHELIPILKRYNPSIEESISNLSKVAMEYEEHVKNDMDSLWLKYKDAKNIDYFALAQETPLMQKKLLLRKIKEICGNINFQHIHLDKAVEKIKDAQDTTWTISLPESYILRRSYDVITVEPEEANLAMPYFEYKMLPGKSYVFPKINAIVQARVEKNDKTQKKDEKQRGFVFDYDRINKIGEHITIRQRKPGDRIIPLGHNSKKKTKEILIDKKIPSVERDEILVFEVGGEIMWLAGVMPSDAFKVTKDTKKILRLALYKIQEEADA